MKEFLCDSVFFGVMLSLLAYGAGVLLKKKFRLSVFNPLLIAIIIVMIVLAAFHVDYESYNQGGTVPELSADPGLQSVWLFLFMSSWSN